MDNPHYNRIKAVLAEKRKLTGFWNVDRVLHEWLMIPPQTKDKLKTLIIISATMHLNLDVAQRANQSQERTLEFG